MKGIMLEMPNTLNTHNFKKGDAVRYIPNHANGNINHPHCQDGIVSSINKTYVFVEYDNAMCKMLTGDEPYTAQATLPENLAILDSLTIIQ